MFDGSVDPSEHKQALSALADGELDEAAVQGTCAAWRDDAGARRAWRTYHLIGDVLRSDDLASPAGHDGAFLAALRARLEREPVVLAPEPMAAHQPAAQPLRAAGGRRAWAAPVAVAAGFVAVAGVLAVTRMAAPVGGAPASAIAALAPQQAGGLRAVAASSSPAAAEAPLDVAPLGPDMKLVRDAYLDRYLAAHKQYGNSTAVSVPGVTLRNAATFVPER